MVSLQQGQQCQAAGMRDVGHPAIKFLFIQQQEQRRTQSCARQQQLPAPGTLCACPSPPGGSQRGTPVWAVEQAVSFCKVAFGISWQRGAKLPSQLDCALSAEMGIDFPQATQSWALLRPLWQEENSTQQHPGHPGGQNPPVMICKT